MREIKSGKTRMVFVGKKRAYKIPLMSSWKVFLTGLLANINETENFKKQVFADRDYFCPVLFVAPLGVLLVMPTADTSRAENLPDSEMRTMCTINNYTFPSDIKPANFGYLKDKLVCIDYSW